MVTFTTRPEIIGTFGVAASTHWLASQTAMRMLELGGNAFDGAVAAAFVLHVAEPNLNGPFGDVPILIHDAGERRQRVICGQGPAPAAASIAAFAKIGITEAIPGDGLTPAAIPGAVDAWLLLLETHGRLDLATVLEPAISYAEHGVPLATRVVEAIADCRETFKTDWPTSAAVFLPRGRVPKAGTLLKNPALAATYRRLVTETSGRGREAQLRAARAAWSGGFVAEAVDDWCRTARAKDQTGRANAAFLTGADMAGWSASFEEPLAFDYAGHRVLKCGPWSQGPVLLQTLALLDGIDIAAMDPVGADFVHTVTEAIKLAYADRDTFYGDPDAVEVPMRRLLGKAYNNARRRLIGASASRDYRPGTVEGYGFAPDYAAACARVRLGDDLRAAGKSEPTTSRKVSPGAGRPNDSQRGDTCYLCVIDRDGNMVSATPSGGWLTSSPVIPAIGMPLGTRLQMCWLDPKAPASLKPGARPRTTLTPSMVLRDDGTPYLCIGSPGGDGQDQWQVIALLRHLHHGLNLQATIDAPSFHSEHFPSSFFPREARPARLVVEDRLGAGVIDELSARGHDIERGGPWSEGRLAAASRSADGTLRAGANPRGMQNYAVGR